LGVPFELVSGGFSSGTSVKSKSEQNTRVFTTNMMTVCR